MTPIDIIKKNKDELDEGDFTTLLSTITIHDPVQQFVLADALQMFSRAGVPPFNKVKDLKFFRRLVVLGCSALEAASQLLNEQDYEKDWKSYEEYLRALGIFIFQGQIYRGPNTKLNYYITFPASTLPTSIIQYWEEVTAGTWIPKETK